MASPLGNQPPPTPVFPEGNNSSPSSSPDGSPRSGNMRSRKVETLDPTQVSQEDINSYQRNLDLRTEELFQNLLGDLHRANETSRNGLALYNEEIRVNKLMWADIQSLQWQRLLLGIALAVAVVAVVVLLCLLLI